MNTVLVCGGRDWGLNMDGSFDKELLKWSNRQIDKIIFEHFPYEYMPAVKIITGEARGADQCGVDYAVVNWCDYKGYPADWEKYGKAAGHIRNKQMLDEENVDLVIAFPGGRGTANMIKQAEERNIKVVRIDRT